MLGPALARLPKQSSRRMQIGLGVGNIAVAEESGKYRQQCTGILPKTVEACQGVGRERMSNIMNARQSSLCCSPTLFADEILDRLSGGRLVAAATISIDKEWILSVGFTTHFGAALPVLRKRQNR